MKRMQTLKLASVCSLLMKHKIEQPPMQHKQTNKQRRYSLDLPSYTGRS